MASSVNKYGSSLFGNSNINIAQPVKNEMTNNNKNRRIISKLAFCKAFLKGNGDFHANEKARTTETHAAELKEREDIHADALKKKDDEIKRMSKTHAAELKKQKEKKRSLFGEFNAEKARMDDTHAFLLWCDTL